ncbi:hypothetical protein IFR05_013290 [Cadophora sp. M221]|nr:hypothetical protein IFR05_013290 [Cadophora sp. M221]
MSLDSLGSWEETLIAFAFDIDGVLIHSRNPLPGASDTIQKLLKHKVPFVFLTNRGGYTEGDHSHSPFRQLVPEFADKNILVLGGAGDTTRNLAEADGFRRVITSADIVKTFGRAVHPLSDTEVAQHSEHGREIKYRLSDKAKSVQISAILVWSSPRDWGLDAMIVTDFLLSERGHYLTKSPKNGIRSVSNNGYLQDGQPKMYFCSMDPTWANSCTAPRHTQITFKQCVEGFWRKRTNGADLNSAITAYGKPNEATYACAERVLQDWHREINGGFAHAITTTYMVGDNPDCDILGANCFRSRHGIEWKSILVETGVHAKGSEPAYDPDHIVSDVKEAVKLAFEI